MKDHLFIEVDRRGDYRIMWFIAEYDDAGAILGETMYTTRHLSKAKAGDLEHIVATIAVQALRPQRDSDGFFFESKRDAKVALAAANAAIKGQPWPEWALRAKAEGWKPPKGWHP